MKTHDPTQYFGIKLICAIAGKTTKALITLRALVSYIFMYVYKTTLVPREIKILYMRRVGHTGIIG